MLLSPRGGPALRSPRQEAYVLSRASVALPGACTSANSVLGHEQPARSGKRLIRLQRRKRAGKRASGKVKAVGNSVAAAQWQACSPGDLLRCLQLASGGTTGQLKAQLFARLLSAPVPCQATFDLTAGALKLLTQPPGGHPVRVLGWLPGSSMQLLPGPRRLLGLLPGKALLVLVPGPWWTPSGAAHLLQHVPLGAWLLLAAALAALGVRGVQEIMQGRQRRAQARALQAAVAAADLVRQRSRMLRAVGAVAAELELPEPEERLALPDPDWQRPREWDGAALREWQDFMRQSRALRISRERWWEHGALEEVPHFRAAAKALEGGNKQPEFS